MLRSLWFSLWRMWFFIACTAVIWCAKRAWPARLIDGIGWALGTRYAYAMCRRAGACPVFPFPADNAAGAPLTTSPQPMQGSPNGAEPVLSRRADGRSRNRTVSTRPRLGPTTEAARAARRAGGVPKLVTGTHKDRAYRSLPNGGHHA